MSALSYIRRRVFGKTWPLLKRVILPTVVLLFVVNALVGNRESVKPEYSNLIVPGEALDPILENDVGMKTHKHHEAQPQVAHPSKPSKTQDQPNLAVPQPAPPVSQSSNIDSNSKSNSNSNSKSNSKGDNNSKAKPAKEKKEQYESDNIRNSAWSLAKANITDSHKVRFKGHAITEDTVTLTLMSSADKVFMSLNKREIYRNLQDRGIHVVVLNQHSGHVTAKRVFDTFNPGVEEEMVEFVDDVQDGRIIIFAVLDEASKGLTWRGRNKLRELGSRWSEKLAYRDMWALVTRKGGLKLAETYSNVATADTGYEWGGPVFLRTDFDLEEKESACSWAANERNEARRIFCRSNDGYGALCDCDVTSWKDVFFHADDQLHKNLASQQFYKDLGIAIMATDRPHYLYRTLKSLWEAPGLNRDKVAVYVDAHHQGVMEVAKLFGVHLVVAPQPGNSSAIRIRHKFQRILGDLFMAKFPEGTVPSEGFPKDAVPPFACTSILLLEDDIEVSVDIFKYLHDVSPIMARDPTIMAISSFNFYGYRDVANNLTQLYRTDQVNNIALYLTSKVVHEVIAPKWLPTDSTREWYRSLIDAIQEKPGRAIVYPEVPRARHRAYSGITINGGVQYNLFRDHVLALTTDYQFQKEELERLELSQYEAWLLNTLKASDPIAFDFCKHDFMYDHNPVVMFVNYNSSREGEADWKYAMKCLKTWDIYAEAGWKDVWQFHFHGHLLSVVAYPTSPFSNLKPASYKFVTAPPTTTTTTPTSDASPNSASSPKPSAS
ncbi:protein O-linked-mannose beta-1,2-N-acetylglucosaminyltransferase 1-like [Penaeus chinensis]|uniref:protein O-linked-mannose beta-1,2-N-acetylglucosaminyltransferase 1-like n=1 Tax=Penaeus chinensis TaxID=139456 RepID=UPI001FB61184|nr:protein O-linked-mannose beta-1,2-N-acetylglucosaminyltransferase 1-like [Penaeus chinensis]